MSDIVVVALIGSLTTILVALGGWILNNQSKQIERLTRRVERLRLDGEARVALEKAACEWIGELQGGRTELAVQRDLRDRTEQQSGLRPKLTPADFKAET